MTATTRSARSSAKSSTRPTAASTTPDTSWLGWIPRARSALEAQWARVDRIVLRLQGRVDTPAYDQWLPWAFVVINAALLILLVLARYNSLDLGAETAKYAQAAWQIGEGLKPETTLAGGHVVAEQGSLILYPLGVITAVLPRTSTLLVLKSIALALTIVPLWRIGRRHGRLGIGATSAVVFAYSIFSAVHAMNAADFAPAVLAVPALMWAVLFGFEERERMMVVAAIAALCCRADLGIAIAGLGILLMIERKKRVGLVAALLGVGWSLIAMYGLQRWLGDGYAFLEPYSEFGTTPATALWGIISHPLRFAGIVFAELNFFSLVTLLAPVLFLPLTAPRYLMPAVPLYILYIGADVPVGRLRESAQTVPMTVFVFVATVFALNRTGRVLVKQVRVDRRVLLALLLTSMVFFARDSVTSPYAAPWQWGDTDLSDDVRREAVSLIPDGVPVRASKSVLPLLSERLGVYELVTDVEQVQLAGVDTAVDAAVERVDWIIFDRDDEGLVGDTLLGYRARMLERGWKVDPRDDARIDIYEFTGIIEIQGTVDVQIGTPASSEDPG